MNKIINAISWLLITTIFAFSSIFFISKQYLNLKLKPTIITFISPISEKINRNQITENEGSGIVLGKDDSRAIVIANFLERYNSPLKPYDHYGTIFVTIADKYEIDFRLLPAIAMQESNLCKKIPQNSYNCLGFGIYGDLTTKFNSYEANFERAAKILSEIYIKHDGRLTPEDIEKKYTPPSKGSWANSVNQWMAEMRYDDRELGKKLKTNTNILEFAKQNNDN